MKLFSKHNNSHINTKSVINFPELPDKFNPVLFQKSHKSKHIRISINADLKIKVTFPKHVDIKKALDFFQSKLVWVENNLIKLAKKQEIRQNNSQNLLNNLTKQQFLKKNQYLVTRCQELAQQYQFSIGKISLKRQKTIWGSCSAQNNISLNSNLAFLDYTLIDYVILHELVHTKIKNHSPQFWFELKKILPNAMLLDKKLREFSPNFFKNRP